MSHPGLGAASWAAVHASALVADQQVIAIDSDATIENACEVLIMRGISCAPVFDRAAKHFVGMFDYGDLLTYLLLALKYVRVPEEERCSALVELMGKAARAESIPVKQAADLSRKNPFCAVIPETSLLQIAEIFGSGTHRVAVLGGDSKLQGILTQSNVNKFLSANPQFTDLNATVDKTLEDLNLDRAKVISVSTDAVVLDAMALLCQHGISSVAVVEDNDVLFGNISLSDVKHVMKRHKHHMLYATCSQFVSHVKCEQGAISGQDSFPVFDVRPNHTLRHVMRKLAATRAHRLYVTDGDNVVIGVVSLTDVMRTIYNHAAQS